MKFQGKFRKIVFICMLVALLVGSTTVFAAPAAGALDAGTKFYVPKVQDGVVAQIAALTSSGNKADAHLIKQMVGTPQAVWFTAGTPKTVLQDVRNTVERAADKGTVPVLVAYNIPFRDCAQYSAGGATSAADYEAWIDAFAKGIGTHKALVILEPDGLGIIPWYQPFGTNGLEWCQPAEADPATAAADRFAMMNYAVDALKANPNVRVYLDGTHSGWLAVGDTADRLVMAGVNRADGFFLNISNYQYSANLVNYGKWVSDCIALTDPSSRGNFNNCPNQYWNGGPATGWNGTAMSAYGEWSDTAADLKFNTSGINSRYAMMLGTTQPTTRFVIDTSRNGQGPWQAPAGVFSDAQDWCNPPDRGLGLLPTASTGETLLDAYLWVKIPGASDGQCYRGTSGPLDPARGVQDPAAGMWFPDMALELVHLANPPLP